MEIIARIIEWTKLKCRIQIAPDARPYFKEREIWWASIGANIGSELNGKNEKFERPVLIFRKFNENHFWGIPATSKPRHGIFYFHSPSGEVPQYFVLSQLRTMSPKRLVRKQRNTPHAEFEDVQRRVINLAKSETPAVESTGESRSPKAIVKKKYHPNNGTSSG